MDTSADARFAGSIPQLYDRFLVPLIFEPYAADLARRTALCRPASVLELAAGTGVVTRHLARTLPAGVKIVATDLNQPMLDHAALVGTDRPVEWKQADAMQLPFLPGGFGAVVCQFGVMFFPDKAKAFAEARRVLQPGGTLLFNVWDRIEENEMISTVVEALDRLFPDAPPRFMHRGPHGYFDRGAIARDLAEAGFANPEIFTLNERSAAARPKDVAVGFCQGTPLRAEIEAHGPDALERATQAAAAALAQRFGDAGLEGRIQAHVVVAARD